MKIKTISGAERLSLKRSIDAGTEEQRKTVRSIIEDVKANGDQAVRSYTAKFDCIEIDSPLVTKEEFEEAYTSLDSRLLQVIRQAIENIRNITKDSCNPPGFITERTAQCWGRK